ncbi:hypothetical protein MQX03_04805 [Chryseobacterium aahli]|uniref:hypothetical protein n=1 Tax=Chryseobacterium aahli TaxID=1278643 RepID=UPI001F61C9D8|nr:hypothetical protein [Chryseobacterium aahli]MCI3936506.1 hypothetical protein [Chryseobacterium aahli]
MKKFILGLSLTVFTSGIAFANTSVEKKENVKHETSDSSKKVENSINIFNFDESFFLCRMQVTIDHYDVDGNFLGSTTDNWQESLCLGNPDGTDIRVRDKKVHTGLVDTIF